MRESVRQLEIPWSKKPTLAAPKGNAAPYLLNTTNQTFRFRAGSHDEALAWAASVAKERKSCTTVYEEVDGKCGPRLAAFDVKGERFL